MINIFLVVVTASFIGCLMAMYAGSLARGLQSRYDGWRKKRATKKAYKMPKQPKKPRSKKSR